MSIQYSVVSVQWSVFSIQTNTLGRLPLNAALKRLPLNVSPALERAIPLNATLKRLLLNVSPALKGLHIPARGNAPGTDITNKLSPVRAEHNPSPSDTLCPAPTGRIFFLPNIPGALPRAGISHPFRVFKIAPPGPIPLNAALKRLLLNVPLRRNQSHPFKCKRLNLSFKSNLSPITYYL